MLMPQEMDTRLSDLPPDWEARLGLNGRIYYYSHNSHTVQILPPPEVWKCNYSLPYGWEMAIDYDNKNYYLNHLTQSVTYEDPRTEDDQTSARDDTDTHEQANIIPRRYEIQRDEQLGFGFIAGSEKPVVIRSVTPGGPSEGKLLQNDQIVKIDSENVMMADREHVIELIRGKTDCVVLTVLQPNPAANSSFLKPAKKVARHTDRPKVRFADDIIVNGQERTEGSSPLLLSPGVLRIHLENSQTKSFQFLPDTTAGDAVSAICEKLGFRNPNLFSLVLTPHSEDLQSTADDTKSRKSSSRSSRSEQILTSSSSPDSLLIAPWDCLSKVVNNPAMRHHSCHFRLEFMPKDFHTLARDDQDAFRYLYQQCVNDVISGEVYKDDLTRDEIVKLAIIQMQEFIHSSLPNSPIEAETADSGGQAELSRKFRFPSLNHKVTLKYIEKEYGLRRFLPASLLSRMQEDNSVSRSVRKTIQQHFKNNTPLFGQNSGFPLLLPTSPLTSPDVSTLSILLQLRMQYLKILSPKYLYGGRYFTASMQSILESDITLLIGHHYGISQMINAKTKMVSVLAEFQHILSFQVAPSPPESNNTTVTIEFEDMKSLILSMEPQSAHNMAFMVAGYCRVYGNVEMVLTLPLAESTAVPLYFGPHKVKPSSWSYPPISSLHASSGDIRLKLDMTSPSYFYCDFSEPITPAVLSQDSPGVEVFHSNGRHTPPRMSVGLEPITSANGDGEGIYEVMDLELPPAKLDSSDSNNNNSMLETREDILNNSSLSDSPVSSLSTEHLSDLSSSHSPRFKPGSPLNLQNGQEMTYNGNLGDESDWDELMHALQKNVKTGTMESHSSLPEADSYPVVDYFPPPPPEEVESSVDNDYRDILVPPPPAEAKYDVQQGRDMTSSISETESLKNHDSVNDVTETSDIRRHRMSSFKPNRSELKVFTQVDDDVTSSITAPSTSSMTGSVTSGTSKVRPQSSSGIENVRNLETRRKLQETEELIEYFRDKKERISETSEYPVVPIIRSQSNDSTSDSNHFTSEIDTPIVTSDIASGNKRLRKAEKAAIKNRKSWAGDETLSRKANPDDAHPVSMSNPDIAGTFRKKKSRGFFRRVFGDRKSRPVSMYNMNSSSAGESAGAYDLPYGGNRKRPGRRFRFPTPKLRLRRAFTLKRDRKSVIPTTDTVTQKSHRFRFRPFSKKTKSHGILVISEPCDNVRGVDLLPSGKYTVAGTMFQVNGHTPEAEVITLDNGSKRPSFDNLTSVENAAADEKTESTSDQPEMSTSDVKWREHSPSEAKRPVSFSTFQQPLSGSYDGIITDTSSKLPFVAERRRKASPSMKSSQSLHLSQSSIPNSSTSSGSTMKTPETSESKSDATNSENTGLPVQEPDSRQRPMTLPANFALDSLNADGLPGLKLIRSANRTNRKLIPANNPTVPPEISNNSRLSSNVSVDEPSATSTPVSASNVVVKRKSSKKRKAPLPPNSNPNGVKLSLNGQENVERLPEVTEEENMQFPVEREEEKLSDGEDVFPEVSLDNSLVSEIFSYLECSTADALVPKAEISEARNPAKEDSLLPYDEDYVMPGLKTEEKEELKEKKQQELFQMFYDEMIADSKLTFDDDDDVMDNNGDYFETPNNDDVNSDVNSDDSKNRVGMQGSYDVVFHPNNSASERESPEMYGDSYTEGKESSDTELQGKVTGKLEKNSGICSPEKVVRTEADEESSASYCDTSSERSSSSSKSPEIKFRQKPARLPSYFSYQHLITPMAYEKTLSGARHVALERRKSCGPKPPLPPKPIFH